MKNERPEVGSVIDYIETSSKGANVVRSGIVLGYGNMPAGVDADVPPAQIAYLDTTKAALLNGESWRDAFVRIFDVPHASCKKADRHMFVQPESADDVRKEMFAMKSELETLKAGKPTAEDLDAHVENQASEQKAADATGGKIRMVKGSQAKP